VRAQSSIEALSLSDLQSSATTTAGTQRTVVGTESLIWTDHSWTTSSYLQYYKYPEKEKEEKKKIDPNKEIIKHLIKICKNKK